MKEKYILKLRPFFSKKIWGWEKWSLSCHEDGNSIVENGIYKGKLLSEVLGCSYDFPILTKIINAGDRLSVQVHPDHEYARKNENSQGKTECWYILEASEGAKLIIGIKEGLNKEKFRKIINEGKIIDYFKSIEVKKGDFIYIPAGTVHAIAGGIKLVEVQQNSNITYRLHDWGRGREVHIEKALDVIDYEGKNKPGRIDNFTKVETPYFTVEKIVVNNKYEDKVQNEFHSYIVIGGKGIIQWQDKTMELEEEDTIYIPKDIKYEIEGRLELIKAYV